MGKHEGCPRRTGCAGVHLPAAVEHGRVEYRVGVGVHAPVVFVPRGFYTGAGYTGNAVKLVVWSRLRVAITHLNSITGNYLNGSFGRQAVVRGNNFRPFAV